LFGIIPGFLRYFYPRNTPDTRKITYLMASSNDNVSMALFCDFENVALGVRDANYEKFDIKPVLERLLLKGSIVVKKAYCDWERYKGFKAGMHEANFELIEIPHLRMSGKNSADIRMVVDALDLCYTKSHVDTFVIISGDSDFSPLVSKLRENAKKVIGVGVKQSTSDLLVANCDEFIFYDDLVRESRRQRREAQPAVKRSPEEEQARREDKDKRRNQAMEIIASTFEALMAERGDTGKIWASVLKEAIKRRKPDFSESYYGFRSFGLLLEEARARGLLEFGRDEKSGAYVYRGSGVPAPAAAAGAEGVTEAEGQQGQQDKGFEPRRRNGRGGRTAAERFEERQARRQAEQAARGESTGVAGAEAGGEVQTPWYAPAPQAGEVAAVQEHAVEAQQDAPAEPAEAAPAQEARAKSGKNKQPARKAKADAKAKAAKEAAAHAGAEQAPQPAPAERPAASEAVAEAPAEAPAAAEEGAQTKRPAKGRQGQAGGKSKSAKPAKPAQEKSAGGNAKGNGAAKEASAPAAEAAPAADANAGDAAEGAKPARKPAARGPRRPAKPKAKPEA